VQQEKIPRLVPEVHRNVLRFVLGESRPGGRLRAEGHVLDHLSVFIDPLLPHLSAVVVHHHRYVLHAGPLQRRGRQNPTLV